MALMHTFRLIIIASCLIGCHGALAFEPDKPPRHIGAIRRIPLRHFSALSGLFEYDSRSVLFATKLFCSTGALVSSLCRHNPYNPQAENIIKYWQGGEIVR